MEILIILALLVVNGVFAMYEIALVSSSKARLETMVRNGSKKAGRVLELLEEPEKILSTIQVGITLIGIVSGAYGGTTLADDVQPLFEKNPALEVYAGKLAMIVVVGGITYLSLIIGELVPKSLALNRPEQLAVTFTPFMCVLTKITWPFVWFLSVSTRLINKMLGIRTGEDRPITEEELKFILHRSSQEGVIDRSETEMLRDVFRFGDKRAGELMTHRKEVVYLDTEMSREEVLAVIGEERYSKYLLCEATLDKCLGMVSVKRVNMPITSPYSFTTTPNLVLYFLNNSSTRVACKFSGINKGSCTTGRKSNFPPFPSNPAISFTETIPRHLSKVASQSKYLL